MRHDLIEKAKKEINSYKNNRTETSVNDPVQKMIDQANTTPTPLPDTNSENEQTSLLNSISSEEDWQGPFMRALENLQN